MDIIVTCCCKEKDLSQQLIPAVERYKSTRIKIVHDIALREKKELFFLSGKFGLIHSLTPIPWYDKILLPEEVNMMKDTVKFQLVNYEIKKVNFYVKEINEKDPDPYYQTIQLACRELNIGLQVYYI